MFSDETYQINEAIKVLRDLCSYQVTEEGDCTEKCPMYQNCRKVKDHIGTSPDEWELIPNPDEVPLYKYEFVLGDDKPTCFMSDAYGVVVDEVTSYTNHIGVRTFCMFSPMDNKMDFFLREISRTLSDESTAVYKAYEQANGNFHQFDRFLGKYKGSRKDDEE